MENERRRAAEELHDAKVALLLESNRRQELSFKGEEVSEEVQKQVDAVEQCLAAEKQNFQDREAGLRKLHEERTIELESRHRIETQRLLDQLRLRNIEIQLIKVALIQL